VTPFDDLRDYVALPRLTGLRLSPDGGWLAATVQTLSADGKKFSSSLWRIATGQGGPGQEDAVQAGAGQGDAGRADAGDRAVRLTRSAEGETSPEFLPDGALLFLSKRPDRAAGPPAASDDKAKPALWLLPPGGGEARRIVAPSGGVAGLATPRGAMLVALASLVLPGAAGIIQDAERRQARGDAGVTAILHESAPVRYWDHDLGPDELRLLLAEIGPDSSDSSGAAGSSGAADSSGGADARPEPRDLTPEPGRALDEEHFELTPDGRLAVTGWAVWDDAGSRRHDLVVIDCATGERAALLSAPGFDFHSPRISPDGRSVLCIREMHETREHPGDVTLVVAALPKSAAGDGAAAAGRPAAEDLLPGFDRWPVTAAWGADSRWVYFAADDGGRCPIFRAGTGRAAVTKITTDDAAYSSLIPSPDGRFLYALRAAVNSPPAAVRIDLAAPATGPQWLAGPAEPPELPGRLTEIEAVAEDGAAIRGWLALPSGASASAPAPLLLWVHGGPLSSWNSWSWRWNPWLMVARGYAVLLPDPALSTGYGRDFIARGHGEWGGRPYTDVMAITDAAVARPDIDESRTGMMGGSFGGYMANWIAGHTSRFRGIVSHASVWALDQTFGTTDTPGEWRRQFGRPLAEPERYAANSPHLHAANIATPMLVIHGDKDYRVPVGEALRLWADLSGVRGGLAGAKFLYFPDENHWVLTPGNSVIWYETVLAFLAQHVLGEPWRRPELL
jgi:dipeptidyl aminopeptidase/acylaminoacyl peptidase